MKKKFIMKIGVLSFIEKKIMQDNVYHKLKHQILEELVSWDNINNLILKEELYKKFDATKEDIKLCIVSLNDEREINVDFKKGTTYIWIIIVPHGINSFTTNKYLNLRNTERLTKVSRFAAGLAIIFSVINLLLYFFCN